MKVEGYFSNIKTANKALAEIKKFGYENAILDINDHHILDRNVQSNIPGTESSPSLSGLILKSDRSVVSSDKAPLTAANPMVSGMGGFEEVADFNYKVVAEVHSENVDKIKNVITSMEGTTENPNVELPKNMGDINFL
jgi:hypothetical protein